jgi:hypothetical protein
MSTGDALASGAPRPTAAGAQPFMGPRNAFRTMLALLIADTVALLLAGFVTLMALFVFFCNAAFATAMAVDMFVRRPIAFQDATREEKGWTLLNLFAGVGAAITACVALAVEFQLADDVADSADDDTPEIQNQLRHLLRSFYAALVLTLISMVASYLQVRLYRKRGAAFDLDEQDDAMYYEDENAARIIVFAQPVPVNEGYPQSYPVGSQQPLPVPYGVPAPPPVGYTYVRMPPQAQQQQDPVTGEQSGVVATTDTTHL